MLVFTLHADLCYSTHVGFVHTRRDAQRPLDVTLHRFFHTEKMTIGAYIHVSACQNSCHMSTWELCACGVERQAPFGTRTK